MRHRRDRRLKIRGFPAVRPIIGPLLGLLLIGGIAFGVRIHQQFVRLDAATRASQDLRDIRLRLLELDGGLRTGEVAPGLMVRLQNRADLDMRAGRVRRFLRGDSLGLLQVDTAMRECAGAMEAGHQALLLKLEERLARDQRLEARAEDLAAHSAAAFAQSQASASAASEALTRLQERTESVFRQVVAASRTADVLLLFALALMAVLTWITWHSHREQSRYLKGARLVEEMLEAYSRRLETMNAELEQVSLLKTQFLANTSHELLTPLNGIMGSLEVIRDGACATREEEREFLQQAYHSAERLLELIHDLLDLCRLEEGNLALRSRGLDLSPLIERAVMAHRPQIETRGLALLVVPPAEGWPRVQADPERLNRVLQHLLSNAVKFTEQGSIRVTGRVEREGGGLLRVEVADTGVGIEPQKLPKVFELFQQGDGSDTRRFGGTGLGLTLCRHLIHGMGGTIGMESDGHGRGARAWFTIPTAPAACSAPGTREESTSDRRAA